MKIKERRKERKSEWMNEMKKEKAKMKVKWSKLKHIKKHKIYKVKEKGCNH